MTAIAGQKRFDVGKGPYIIYPDGRYGHLDAKFPDQGSWPFDILIDSYVREMAWAISAANMSRYLVLFCKDGALPEEPFFTPLGNHLYQWPIPLELARQCPVPFLFYNIRIPSGAIFAGGTRSDHSLNNSLSSFLIQYSKGSAPAADIANAMATFADPGLQSHQRARTGATVDVRVAGTTGVAHTLEIAVAGFFFPITAKDVAAVITA